MTPECGRSSGIDAETNNHHATEFVDGVLCILITLESNLCACRLRGVLGALVVNHDYNGRRADERAFTAISVNVGAIRELPTSAALTW